MPGPQHIETDAPSFAPLFQEIQNVLTQLQEQQNWLHFYLDKILEHYEEL